VLFFLPGGDLGPLSGEGKTLKLASWRKLHISIRDVHHVRLGYTKTFAEGRELLGGFLIANRNILNSLVPKAYSLSTIEACCSDKCVWWYSFCHLMLK
jgi:hypothetical protein